MFQTPKNSKDITVSAFLNYLIKIPVSQKSYKNYRSDISLFAGWLILKIRSLGYYVDGFSESVPFLNKSLAVEYKSFLLGNKASPKSINRRLSTLRHLGRFLLESQILSFDFSQDLENINISKETKEYLHPLVIGFERHLSNQKVAKNTIKNYLSDIRQFFTWLETNQ